MKDASPNLTPAQVYSQLQSTAEDIHIPGHDDLTGVGLVNAFDAIFGSAMPTSIDFGDDFEDGDLDITYETNSSGAGRIKVTGEHNPIDSSHLILHSGADGGSIDSLNEVILHFDAANLDNIQLSFDQKEYNDEDHPMSASFINSEDSDGVALSVDGTNWYSLVSLTGNDSTNSYENTSFDLSAFAVNNNLSLGSDVQIKFQQFDNSNINLDGMAFDNIAITGDNTTVITPTSGDDSLFGTQGNDTINALAGNDTVDGFNGNDSILGANGNDTLLGSSGLDLLRGGNGRDSVNGGDDDDYLAGGDSNDSLIGGNGSDRLNGGNDDDYLAGGYGLDTLLGSSGNDTLFGGQGNDLVRGEAGNDSLTAGGGNDTVIGGNGNDYLDGKEENDILIGGQGNDTLMGSYGLDVLLGKTGQDTFVLMSDLDTGDRDVIRDFELDTDVLGVSDLAEIEDFSIRNNGSNTASLITNGSSRQLVAVLVGVTDDFYERP